VSDVDLVNYYGEYVCPPSLLEIDHNMLEARLPVPTSAILLSTRHLCRSWTRSTQPLVSHITHGSSESDFTGRLTNHSADSAIFSDTFVDTSHQRPLGSYTQKESLLATTAFTQDNHLPHHGMSSETIWTTFPEPFSDPTDNSHVNYVAGIDDAVFGERSFNQNWTSSLSAFNEPSSNVADGTVDPSLLGGIQQPKSPSPSRPVSPSCSVSSVEQQHHSRASWTAPTRRNPVLRSSPGYDSDFEPDHKKRVHNRSRKQRLEHGGRGRGRPRKEGRALMQSNDISDSASETAIRKRSLGSTSQKRESAATEHPWPAERKLDYCHQCRNATVFEKMTCTKMLDFGVSCGKKYCVGCILKRYSSCFITVAPVSFMLWNAPRYPAIEFYPYATRFICPSCTSTCNCTACCAKRKEPYISTRHVKIDKETLELIGSGAGPRTLPSASEEFTRKSKEINNSTVTSGSKANLLGSETRRSTLKEKQSQAGPKHPLADGTTGTTDPTHISKFIESYSGTSGAYWGTIFSVTGDRIGAGFVGESGTEIVLKAPQSPARRKKRRLYVGKLQEWWGFEDSGEELEPADPQVFSNGKGKGKARAQDQHGRREYIGDKSVLFRYKERPQRKASFQPEPPTPPQIRSTDGTELDAVPFDPADYSEADAEGEDDNEQEPSHWIIIDSYSPIRPATESMKGMSQEQVHIAMQRAINAMQAG
jgi:hypothetical protein